MSIIEVKPVVFGVFSLTVFLTLSSVFSSILMSNLIDINVSFSLEDTHEEFYRQVINDNLLGIILITVISHVIALVPTGYVVSKYSFERFYRNHLFTLSLIIIVFVFVNIEIKDQLLGNKMVLSFIDLSLILLIIFNYVCGGWIGSGTQGRAK